MRQPTDPSRPGWEDDGAPRVGYRSRLRDLDAAIVAVAADVAMAVRPANAALLAGHAAAVVTERARDEAVRRRCRELEDACVVFLARESPVAADLREVVAILRAVTDVERASRYLYHVVASLHRIHPPAMDDPLRTAISRLADASGLIFRGGARAWETRDGLAVNELSELDDEVDELQEELLRHLYVGGPLVADVVAVALLGRYFERLADHGVALAGQLSWAVTGDRVEAS